MPIGNKIYKSYRAETKAIDDKDGYIKAIVSTEAMDRDGEVILSKAWGNTINEFMTHPVLISSHDYNDLTKQLGEWVDLKVTERGLEGTAKYYIGMGNAEADWGYELAKRGQSAYSVGFIAKDFLEGGTTQNGKEPQRTYTDVELLEISQVSVPSNRESLVTMRSKGIDPIADEIAKELFVKADDTKAPVAAADQYTTEAEALARAEEIGCEGTHTMESEDGSTVYMPCSTHEQYDEIVTPQTEGNPDSYGDEETKVNEGSDNLNEKNYTVMLTELEKAKLMKAVEIINQKNKDNSYAINTEEIVANAFKNLQINKNKEV
jgi:HK97 family phage prohead protease